MKIHLIEFCGGPIDGLVIESQRAAKPFAVVQTIAHATDVNPLLQLFRLLHFEHPEPHVLAVYELDSRGFRKKYRYVGSKAWNSITLDSARVAYLNPSADQICRVITGGESA